MSTSTLTIRRARASDIDAIVAIYDQDPLTGSREDRNGEAFDRYAAAFADIDADSRQLLLVAEESGTVTGTVQVTAVQHLMARGFKVAIIEAFFIDAAHQGKGIGARLLESAEQWAMESGCHFIELTSNKQRPQAHRFYQRHGFVATHEGFKKKL